MQDSHTQLRIGSDMVVGQRQVVVVEDVAVQRQHLRAMRDPERRLHPQLDAPDSGCSGHLNSRASPRKRFYDDTHGCKEGCTCERAVRALDTGPARWVPAVRRASLW